MEDNSLNIDKQKLEEESKAKLAANDRHPDANVNTDPQEKMEGPVSSVMQELADGMEKTSDETIQNKMEDDDDDEVLDDEDEDM